MSKLISKDDFIKLFDNYDITISDSDYSRFEAYADLLCEWNEKINLTAITDPEGISIKHFLISLCFKLIYRDIIDKIKYKKSIYTKSKKSRGDLNERIYIKFRHTNKS